MVVRVPSNRVCRALGVLVDCSHSWAQKMRGTRRESPDSSRSSGGLPLGPEHGRGAVQRWDTPSTHENHLHRVPCLDFPGSPISTGLLQQAGSRQGWEDPACRSRRGKYQPWKCAIRGHVGATMGRFVSWSWSNSTVCKRPSQVRALASHRIPRLPGVIPE